MRLNVKTAFVNQALWFTNAVVCIAAFVNQSTWFTNAAIQTAAFVNQINLKNATAFFTNAFKRKTALNKERSFLHFALVPAGLMVVHTVWNSLRCLCGSSPARPWNLGSKCIKPDLNSYCPSGYWIHIVWKETSGATSSLRVHPTIIPKLGLTTAVSDELGYTVAVGDELEDEAVSLDMY